LADVRTVDPIVHGDERGFFMETWRASEFAEAGINEAFAQDAISRSVRGVLRGLHYQIQRPQGKLVRVLIGEVFDVAVDLRRSSPSFGQWIGERLSAANRRALWIPPGFAHGFYVLQNAEILYKLTAVWAPQHERRLLWNDPEIGISWPIATDAPPIISNQDAAGAPLRSAECFR
jgi:dTDP-4-dehydrorhamnose 3,5-epimerase